MYSIGELRPGMVVMVDGDPFVIVAAQHSKQARQGGIAKTKIRNLLTGSILNKTFQGSDKLEPADVTYGKAQFLYNDDEDFHFMNNDTYEQFTLDHETLEEQANYLIDGTDVDIQYFDGKPISVILPPKIDLEVAETEPGVKGDTASGGSKPATLVTGYTLQVPLFINVGERIRINTQTGEYVERAN